MITVEYANKPVLTLAEIEQTSFMYNEEPYIFVEEVREGYLCFNLQSDISKVFDGTEAVNPIDLEIIVK